MRRYLARRMLFAVLTLWGVTILVFGLSRLGPDPLLAYVRDEHLRTVRRYGGGTQGEVGSR